MDIFYIVPLKKEIIDKYAILFHDKKLNEISDNNDTDIALKKSFFKNFSVESSKLGKYVLIKTDTEKSDEYLVEPILKTDFKKILEKATYLNQTLGGIN